MGRVSGSVVLRSFPSNGDFMIELPHRKLIDRLEQVVLAKAFREELVPQDAAAEPTDACRGAAGSSAATRRGRCGAVMTDNAKLGYTRECC